ncbi:MAG: NarK/NasA family nitrate transporter [Isosphaeraceae bacterium]|nr:NarK/NasA family nitrate transporter [Isosphaeraceae bacterium]
MNLRDFRRAGHLPTLIAAFLYFDVSFMAWMLVGALANAIALSLGGLSDAQKGLMVAVPVLGGSILRLVLGPLADHIGARRTGLIGMTMTLLPLLLGWLWADSFARVLLIGLLLGVAGASFAAALPLAGRWYPPQYQGLALGIAGAGNSGTALATFFGPHLAERYGWHAVFGLALIPLLLVLIVFARYAQDSPHQPPPKSMADYLAVLRLRDTWWFCLFYAVTFGGFVGLASFLSIFFHDQYGLTKVQAGGFTTLCVVAGSFLRPVGGHLADRLGGIRLLALLYLGEAAAMLALSTLPPLSWATLLLFVGMGLLGMGNGAVFQLVPQRFPREIGVLTGLVGAAGGLGGFVLPNALGLLKGWTGSFGGGFLAFGFAIFGSALALGIVGRSWQGAFVSRGGCAATEAEPGPAGWLWDMGSSA